MAPPRPLMRLLCGSTSSAPSNVQSGRLFHRVVCGRPSCIHAVSYTHLDVYKRQAVASINEVTKKQELLADTNQLLYYHYIKGSAALCEGETCLLYTSAYTAFPNKGIRVAPLFVTRIEDNDGNVLATLAPEMQEVISVSSAYKMLVMLLSLIHISASRHPIWKD